MGKGKFDEGRESVASTRNGAVPLDRRQDHPE